mmetsp:Transcript_16179/g.45085  ORF Transcript_16179/g.45085 Transcript_16179/m.45085 type:complete len:268 (-) Transcript_16179:855-1658(-)
MGGGHGHLLRQFQGIVLLQAGPVAGDNGGGHTGPEFTHAWDVVAIEKAIKNPGGVGIPSPAGVYGLVSGPVGLHMLHPPEACDVRPPAAVCHHAQRGVAGQHHSSLLRTLLLVGIYTHQGGSLVSIGKHNIHPQLQDAEHLRLVPLHNPRVSSRHHHQRPRLPGLFHCMGDPLQGARHLPEVPLDDQGPAVVNGPCCGICYEVMSSPRVAEERALGIVCCEHNHGPRGAVQLRLRDELDPSLLDLGLVELPQSVATNRAPQAHPQRG